MAAPKDKFNILKRIERSSMGQIPLSEVLVKLGLILSLIVVIPLMFPSGRSFKYSDLAEGSIANKKVIAPFTFSVLKTDEELGKERTEARDKVPYYFTKNDTINQMQMQNMESLIDYVSNTAQEIPSFRGTDQISTMQDSTTTDSLSIQYVQNQIRNQYNLFLREDDLLNIFNPFRGKQSESLRKKLISDFRSLNALQYINLRKSEIHNSKIILLNKGIEEDALMSSFSDGSEVLQILNSKLSTIEYSESFIRIFNRLLHPNIEYMVELTERRRKETVAAVSLGKDVVYENERIVDANERITKDIYQKLFSLEYAIAERSEEEGDLRSILSYLGRYLLTGLILLLYVIYLWANRRKIYRDNKKLLLITVLIFLQVGVGALIVGPLGWPSYVIPTTISSMLLGILFDPGIGFVGTVVIGLLLAGITGFDYSFAVLTMFVGLVAIYSVTKIRTRNQIFKAILYILSAYIIVVFTMGTLRYQELQEIGQILVYYLLPTAVLSPFITYMMLGVFERLFDITTDVTLLELSDLNHPLLKDLSVKAPGTFHHSIIVGNLSESAAIMIGANSLLARVGSYYHDIGKMEKPEYFVENQKDKNNKHQGLAPNMSAIILSSHVKNGLEMAEKYKLPKLIRDFIPEHHGKNLMGYFYNKAKEENDPKDINEADYRYPGPSPKSKETAIVMLADTVEAATRTLSNPSAGRLRKHVEELVEKRFLEGELDDSDLTMRDLKGIIDGFMSVLLGIFHQRIEYPKAEENKKTNTKNGAKKEKPVKVVNNEDSGAQQN
jgi:putative nucleotidyltransferase with HDIG domain